MTTPAFNFAFILDQQVGLRTQALNFERVIAGDETVKASWIPVHYRADAGILTRLPGVPNSIKGTLRGIQEIREGVGDAGRFDAALWSTWAAKSVVDLVGAVPAFLVMDMTPMQMEAMGTHYGYTPSRARFLGGWKRRATEQLYQKATHLFPWNEWVADSLRNDYGVPAHKITPVSPGVDVGLYQPDLTIKPQDEAVRLLFVGGDFQRKGGDLLLRWAHENRSAETPWELHLVTRDPIQTELPNVFVHRGLTNNSDELVRLYQRSDVFVLPTRADCYSLVALEAMATGLPVVISKLGGIPHIVEEGATGYLIEVDDYETLSTRLGRLLKDPAHRQELGEAGRRRACSTFDCQVGITRILTAMKAASRHQTSPGTLKPLRVHGRQAE